MQALLADKEDTQQVFHIIEALNGRALESNFEAFINTPEGRQQLRKKEYLPLLLDDHGALLELPENSVGRAYVRFMERESLSAQGLVEESERGRQDLPRYNDDLEWFSRRLRNTHDLFYVLTRYGRDALGEASLLGFSYGQNPGRGLLFIGYLGARNLAKVMPKDVRL